MLIINDLHQRLETRRILDGVREVPRIDRPRVVTRELNSGETATGPPSLAATIESALREVAIAREHLDNAEHRLLQLLTRVEDTRPPEPCPNQSNQ